MTGIELIQAGPQIQALYANWHPSPDPARDWTPYLVIAAFDGATVMGYASSLLLENGTFLLSETIVRPEGRRQGLAKLLMRARLFLATELRATRAVATCGDDWPMLRVLKEYGFEARSIDESWGLVELEGTKGYEKLLR